MQGLGRKGEKVHAFSETSTTSFLASVENVMVDIENQQKDLLTRWDRAGYHGLAGGPEGGRTRAGAASPGCSRSWPDPLHAPPGPPAVPAAAALLAAASPHPHPAAARTCHIHIHIEIVFQTREVTQVSFTAQEHMLSTVQ